MLNPKEKRKENKKYQFIHNTVVADREKKQNKARKLYLHKCICLWTEMAQWVKELASWRRTHCVDISIFFLLTSFFYDFLKKALGWLFQTSSIPSPSSPLPGLVPKSSWRKILLQMLWRLSANGALRSGCEVQKGRGTCFSVVNCL